MAVFDVETQKLVVRVVYDGAAFAGKTTNVRALCEHFTSRRRSELIGADEIDGRTLFFDWVQIEAGLAGGFQLSCQVISVPGQAVLAARRRHLVAQADVVVFVCDSGRARLDESREALSTLRQVLDEQARDVAILLQANKQDSEDALQPSELVEALGLPEATPVVAARASDGVGVVETLVLAIRSAADAVQRAAEDTISVRAPDRPEDVLAELRAYEVSDESLIELLSFSEPDESARPTRPAPRAEPAIVIPPLPTGDVATGFIWPALGRELLREIDHAQVVVRDDLIGRHGASDGSGKSDVIVLRAGDFCLKTSERRRFVDVDHARNSLLLLARTKMRLGELLLPQTVLALQPDDDNGFWLWTVTPWVRTLRADMSEAATASDESALGEALERFARAAIDALVLASRHEVALDVHPGNYAVVGSRLHYLDDDVGTGPTLPAIGDAILRRGEEYARFPRPLARYGDSLIDAALRHLRDEERAALAGAVREAVVRAPSAERLRALIVSALSGDDASRAAG